VGAIVISTLRGQNGPILRDVNSLWSAGLDSRLELMWLPGPERANARVLGLWQPAAGADEFNFIIPLAAGGGYLE
jgi:hypothetical protein